MKKKVLFIGVTKYNLEKDIHLRKKFEGLSQGMKAYVLAKGRPFHKKIWGAEFYLLPKNIFFWLLAPFLAFWLCLVKKIDVIIAQSPLMEGLVGSILKKIFKKELIVEIHGDWEAGFPKIRKFLNCLAKFSLTNADKIRAISNFTAKKAKAICPHKPYFFFPTFTDIDSFLNETEIKFENFILFVGNLQRIKGVDILIYAFSEISKEFPEFKLVLVGEGPERENLRSQILHLGIEDKVEFKGKLSLKDTKNVMKNCYCLVLPSRSEGLGRVLIEAMALSKPVLGSRVGGILDLIKDGHNGFLFEAGNSNKLAEKLRILLSNKNLAMEMGKKGKKFIQDNFSNKKYIENYISMINT